MDTELPILQFIFPCVLIWMPLAAMILISASGIAGENRYKVLPVLFLALSAAFWTSMLLYDVVQSTH